MTRQIRHHLALVALGRRTIALLLIAVMAVPVVAAAQRLRLNIDGDVLHVLSYDTTVAELLDDQGVELAAGDRVLPAASTPLTDVTAITILRTIEVELVIDGVPQTHRGTWRTVEGMLAGVGVTVDSTQVLRPSPRTGLADGDTVTITSPLDVTVVADGHVRSVATHLGTVDALLDNLGVVVAAEDIVSLAPDAPLAEATEIVVQRVGFDTATEEVRLPFEEEQRGTSELFTDQSRVVQEGVSGLRIDTYNLTFVDGELTDRELASQEVVTEPTTRIVEKGTTKRPPKRMADDGSVWYDLAQCESGGRWDYNGSSGFDGGLQFHPSTWSRHKLSGYPQYAYQASPSQQIEVGKRVQRAQGWNAWPSCARKLGLI